MFKIWAKIMQGDKMVSDLIAGFDGEFNRENFFDCVSTICHRMDISTPIVLQKHVSHFNDFNNTVFTKGDFVDEVKFDKFILEYCREQKKKST